MNKPSSLIWMVFILLLILPTPAGKFIIDLAGGIFLIITVYLLYAAFLTEGQAQARLTAVIAGPIWVWFIVCAALELDVTYATENPNWELSGEMAPPLILWGMTALTGVLGWNSEE